MRGARWVLIAAIFAILGAVGLTYKGQRREQARQAPQKPELLPVDVDGKAEDWHWIQRDKGRAIVEIRASNVKQEKDNTRLELDRVRLQLYNKDGSQYDYVESPGATFHPSEDKLFSEGEVMITLAVPTEGQPTRQLVSIKTSGVTFESKNGRASTDRLAWFTFQNGTGKSIGATYDPATRELQLRGNVELNWRAPGPNTRPMKVESGELIYKEQQSLIFLFPWARLKRDNSVIEANDTIVTLKDGAINRVEAKSGKGTDEYPDRRVEYSADQLTVTFTDDGEVDTVTGEKNARLVSSNETSQTTVTTDRVDLKFESRNHESILKSALAMGRAAVETKPLPGTGVTPPETRILRSETIEMKMRPGGREMESVVTTAPGQIEFLPNRPEHRHRTMKGERIWIEYGERNLIRSFRSVNVETVSDAAVPANPAAKTVSKNLLAEFDPKTGQMVRMREWDDFQYSEGTRRATAEQAILENDSNRITLERKARIWDPTGSTSANTIRLDQQSGDFIAEGRVTSSRVPDKNTNSSSGLLSGEEALQGMAERMTSRNKNSFIRYEGGAVLWQGANRVKGDTIDIDREARRLVAKGAVETQFLEKRKETEKAGFGPRPAFTIVKAAGLVYTDGDRLAYYTGGVLLTQPSMRVKATELRAHLAQSGSENNLERAFADGKVEISQRAPDRTRTGTGEHAEYYVADEKVVLRGGNPLLADSLRGNTRGSELTYFAGDDRLLVNGVPERPATSRLRRK